MPNKLFWLQVNLDEFHKETIGLLVEQLGAAWHLLEASWHQEPPCTLPNDARVLATVSQLGARWPRLGAALMALWLPREDGRLHWPWLTRTYEAQLAKYEKRSAANTANRAKRGNGPPTIRTTNRATNRSTNGTTSGTTNRATNGERIVVPLSRENLELRSTALGSNEPKSSTAPEARASADEARAAPGAPVETGTGAPSDDSDSGRAVDTRRGGGAPEAISDVIQQLRPPGAVIRPSVAKERELAIAWAHEHPEHATAIERELQEGEDRKLWEKAKPKQRESMLVSAFVKAMNEAGKTFPVPEHSEVSP